MLNFFNGKYGLARTYWFGVFGAGLVAHGFGYWINYQYLTSAVAGNLDRLELYQTTFQVLFSLYLAFMLRALWRAGNDDRNPGIWGWAGLILTALGLFYTVVSTVLLMFPSVATPMFMMQLEIREFNKQLPQDMGGGMVMVRTEIADNTLTYFVKADHAIDQTNLTAMKMPMIDNQIGQELCLDSHGYFKGGLRSIEFHYAFTNQTVEQALSGVDCITWLDQRN